MHNGVDIIQMTSYSDDPQDDIFAEWKTSRFVVADRELFPYEKTHIIIMSDILFFSYHLDSIVEWCEQHSCKIYGVTIEVPSDETLMLFMLRWS